MQRPQPQIIRVIDLETTGQAPPTHGVCEIGWQDVALGKDGRWELEGDGGSILVNPGRPIPPITQAIHHILTSRSPMRPGGMTWRAACSIPGRAAWRWRRTGPISSSNIAPPP